MLVIDYVPFVTRKWLRCEAGASGLSSVLQKPDTSSHSARAQMISGAYPVLDSLLQHAAWRSHEPVMQAVCEVYSHVICSVQAPPHCPFFFALAPACWQAFLLTMHWASLRIDHVFLLQIRLWN